MKLQWALILWAAAGVLWLIFSLAECAHRPEIVVAGCLVEEYGFAVYEDGPSLYYPSSGKFYDKWAGYLRSRDCPLVRSKRWTA